MKTFLKLVALFLALLGCPLRAEIVEDKKVFTPSPTSTLQTMVEELYGNKVKVICPRAVHRNLKSLTYVPMGLVLKVDAARHVVRVEEAYPAKDVDELDAKIAARTSSKKKKARAVVKTTPQRRVLPAPAKNVNAPGPKMSKPPLPVIGEEGATFLDHTSVARSFDLKTVQAAMKEASDEIIGLKQNQQSVAVVGKQRDEATAANTKLTEEIKTLTHERDEAKAGLDAEQNKVKAEQAITKSAMIERNQALAQLATANAEKDQALWKQKRSYEGERGLLIFGAVFLIAVVSWISLGIGRWQARREERKKTQRNLGDMSASDLMRTSARDDVKHTLTGTTDADPDAWPNGRIPDVREEPKPPPSKEERPALATPAADPPASPDKQAVHPSPFQAVAPPPRKPVRPEPLPPVVAEGPPRSGNVPPRRAPKTVRLGAPPAVPEKPPHPSTLKTVAEPYTPQPRQRKAEVTVIHPPVLSSAPPTDDDTVIFPPVSSPAPPVVESTIVVEKAPTVVPKSPPVLKDASTYEVK